MKNMFIDTFKTTADRIAFGNRGKGITSPDVQSAIEEVYEKAVSGGGNGGNGGNGGGGDNNVIIWVSQVSFSHTLFKHQSTSDRGSFEIDVDPRFTVHNFNDYDHFLLVKPYLYTEIMEIDAEAMLTSVFFWNEIIADYDDEDELLKMSIQYTNLSQKTLSTTQGDTVVVLSVKK
jgi:hypothetical protein